MRFRSDGPTEEYSNLEWSFSTERVYRIMLVRGMISAPRRVEYKDLVCAGKSVPQDSGKNELTFLTLLT
jgi:hypothetical protein